MASSQLVVRPRFDHPVPGLKEASLRYDYFKKLEDFTNDVYDDFILRAEQVATVLFVDLKELRPGGSLSEATAPISELKDRLEGISPFCKHYMLHLDPENLRKKEWRHAIPQMPTPQPRFTTELIQEQDWDKIELAMYYSARFKSSRELRPVPFVATEEDICRRRSNNRCVLTGNPNPKVFWFFPSTWNDTVDHNDATGSLMDASIDLVDVQLLDLVCSTTQLGLSHKSWNMLCIDPLLYKYITTGCCGFKYGQTVVHNDGKARVKLYFYWMPQEMTARFHRVLNKSDIQQLVKEFNDHCNAGCPVADEYLVERDGKATRPPQSGDCVEVVVSSESEALRLECAVKVHWACIVFTALLGGAGQAYRLTGMDHRNGALQPYQSTFGQGPAPRGARWARQKDSSEETSSSWTSTSGRSTAASYMSTNTSVSERSGPSNEGSLKK